MNKKLRKMLIDREMRIRELAALAGYSESHVANVIIGRFESRTCRKAIADALGVPLDSLWPDRREGSAREGAGYAGLA